MKKILLRYLLKICLITLPFLSFAAGHEPITIPAEHTSCPLPGDSLHWGILSGMVLNTYQSTFYNNGSFSAWSSASWEYPSVFISNSRFVPMLGVFFRNNKYDMHLVRLSGLPSVSRSLAINAGTSERQQYQFSASYQFDLNLNRRGNYRQAKFFPNICFGAAYIHNYFYGLETYSDYGLPWYYAVKNYSNSVFLYSSVALKYMSRHNCVTLSVVMNLAGADWYGGTDSGPSWESSYGGSKQITVNELVNEGLFFNGLELSYSYMFK
jgi:hypothetical protein